MLTLSARSRDDSDHAVASGKAGAGTSAGADGNVFDKHNFSFLFLGTP